MNTESSMEVLSIDTDILVSDLTLRWPFFENLSYDAKNMTWKVVYNDNWGDLIEAGAKTEFESFNDVIDYLDELESTKEIPDPADFGFDDDEEE